MVLSISREIRGFKGKGDFGGGVLKIQPRFRVVSHFQGVIKIIITAETKEV